MERFLSPGFKVQPKVEAKPKGRPKVKAAEGALDLGEKRARVCGSKKVVVDEQRMREMERRLELLETVHSQAAASYDKLQKVLSLHEQAEEENKQLRELLKKRRSGTTFETPDRKPSGGLPSPDGAEIPCEGPGRSEASGRHFGILGNCEAALRGGELGREFGNCEAALRGGALGNCEVSKKGGQLSPEMLEKCRQAGREAGMRGKEWGTWGGRPKEECEPGQASQMAQKGLVRPQKWEPQVGHQMQAVKYIRQQLRKRRLGKFTQEEGAQEEWEEPEATDVQEEVWAQIREDGFGGKNVKSRDLKRIWIRRHTIAQNVDLLELGISGGVFKRNRRTEGKMRQGCSGSGQRCAVAVSRPEGGEEGGKAGREVVTRRRASALKPIFDEIKITFEKWRMGGQYVDSEDVQKLRKHGNPTTKPKPYNPKTLKPYSPKTLKP